jgi:hypothetical protein
MERADFMIFCNHILPAPWPFVERFCVELSGLCLNRFSRTSTCSRHHTQWLLNPAERPLQSRRALFEESAEARHIVPFETRVPSSANHLRENGRHN